MQSPVGGCARASVPGYELFGAAFLLQPSLWIDRFAVWAGSIGFFRVSVPLVGSRGCRIVCAVVVVGCSLGCGSGFLVVVSSSLVRLSVYLPPNAWVLLHGCLEC